MALNLLKKIVRHFAQRIGIYDVALAIWAERSGAVYAVLYDVLFCEL